MTEIRSEGEDGNGAKPDSRVGRRLGRSWRQEQSPDSRFIAIETEKIKKSRRIDAVSLKTRDRITQKAAPNDRTE